MSSPVVTVEMLEHKRFIRSGPLHNTRHQNGRGRYPFRTLCPRQYPNVPHNYLETDQLAETLISKLSQYGESGAPVLERLARYTPAIFSTLSSIYERMRLHPAFLPSLRLQTQCLMILRTTPHAQPNSRIIQQ